MHCLPISRLLFEISTILKKIVVTMKCSNIVKMVGRSRGWTKQRLEELHLGLNARKTVSEVFACSKFSLYYNTWVKLFRINPEFRILRLTFH